MRLLRKIFFLGLVLLPTFFLSILIIPNVFSQTCGSVDECQKLIGEYQGQITKLQGQVNTLSNQIAQFNAQITLTSLKIKQTEEKIALLGGRINQLEISLDDLTKAFASRAVETYKLARSGSTMFLLLTSSNLNEVVSRFHYLQVVQEEDGNFLQRLQTAQVTYKSQKTDQEELQAELAKQKANLDSQKKAKASLLAVTKNDQVRYAKLLSDVQSQLSKFRNFVANRGGASILENQIKCDDGWTGCYYNQRDSLWGNMFLGGTNYLMKDSGCFVTSVAMLASHDGKNIKPNDISSIPAIFTNQGDFRWEPFNVNGINVSISSDSIDKLDQYLASKRPVVAKLSFSYGDHFIVILKKEGETYIMNDPFLKDGYNKPLSAGGYTKSDMKSLRLVQFK